MKESYPLSWPEGWIRTRIQDRKAQAAWKKSANEARDGLIKELERMGVESMLISTNIPTKFSGALQTVQEPRDPGVAVYFSRKLKEDYTWQDILGINDPAPSLDVIDRAYREKARLHHPDSGGDLETFKMITAARDRAKAWVNMRENQDHQYVIACDQFKEVRHNITAIRLTIAAIRQMERCGTSSLLERAFKGFEAITEKSSVAS